MNKINNMGKGKGIGSNTKLKINNFNCSYGTIDRKQTKAVYIETCTYVMPDYDYKKDIDKFKWNIEREMNKYIKKKFPLFKTFNIYSIDERQTRQDKCNDKFSLLPLELTIVFSNKIIYDEHIKTIEEITHELINYIQSYDKGLVFNEKIYK